jgi:hypothetical protein
MFPKALKPQKTMEYEFKDILFMRSIAYLQIKYPPSGNSLGRLKNVKTHFFKKKKALCVLAS